MSFRWYGDSDPVSLAYIRQIPGMHGIVSAVYDVPVGEAWPLEKILALKAKIEAQNLVLEVIESVPVHEDIKLGKPSRDGLIANYRETIRNLGKVGIKVICYNFMPVFDWTRTSLAKVLPFSPNVFTTTDITSAMNAEAKFVRPPAGALWSKHHKIRSRITECQACALLCTTKIV